MKKAIKAIISGQVQGVGYRYFAAREASLLGIIGYVRNLYDGRVEVFAEGEDTSIDRFGQILEEGPRFGNVSDIKIENYPPEGIYTNFTIKY